jgi:hypothetical protein
MRRPSPAMLVALLALFVALGGTAMANKGLVTGAQIKDHSIGLVDLSPGAVAKLHGRQGPTGPAGTNASILTKLTFEHAVTALGAGAIGNATATCPAGSAIISGGASTTGVGLWASEPVAVSSSSSGWFAGGRANSLIQAEIDTYVICLSP